MLKKPALRVCIGACIAWTALLLGNANAEGATQQSAPDLRDQAAALIAKVQAVLPGLAVESVFEVPISGLVGLEMADGQTLYGTVDGNYLLSGDIFALQDSKERPIVNLSEARRATARRRLLDTIPTQEMVVFSPKEDIKTYVSVFTDVDCGYCRKLHQEMADINALGIEVRYLAYPRQGLGTPTYDKIVSAWCASDPNQAMTALKAGKTIPQTTCDNPVARQFELGQKVGVQGTPAIITADGRLLPGYMPAAELARAIGLTGSE